MASRADKFLPLWSGLNHPEDLVWDGDREFLYCGGERGEIYRGTLDGKWAQIAHCGDGSFVLGLALDADGRLYICERGNGRVLKLDEQLALHEISRGTQERPMLCPNYPTFDGSGRLFVSDSGTWSRNDGVIYSIAPGTGATVWATTPSDFTNGLALSIDQDCLYAVESRASKVWRVPIRSDGTAGAPEPIWHVPETVPDGLALDREGNIYIGCYTPDSIYLLDPRTGRSELFAHDWSGQFLQAPTNLAFVGRDLGTLAAAGLCGWSINATTAIAAPGHPPVRPKVTSWHP